MNRARRTMHNRWLVVLAALIAFLATACGSANPLGSGEISGDLKSIKVGSADFPESTGNRLQYFDKTTKATDPDSVLLALYRALPGDLSILTPSPANDQDTVAVTSETAAKWNLKTIADLAEHS